MKLKFTNSILPCRSQEFFQSSGLTGHGLSPQDYFPETQTLFTLYRETSGRILLICVSNHFLSSWSSCVVSNNSTMLFHNRFVRNSVMTRFAKFVTPTIFNKYYSFRLFRCKSNSLPVAYKCDQDCGNEMAVVQRAWLN